MPGTHEPGPFDVAELPSSRVGAGDRLSWHREAREDLRPTSTFISNALANGLTVFETARVAGTSVKMKEAHYGALLDTAHESLLDRLERATVAL